MKKKEKPCFTLAEVLITIGIIGIVAALTIPNLITAYQARKFRSQFFKSYSTLQQAIRKMQADEISVDAASYEPNTFYKEFQKYIPISQDCGSYTRGVKNTPGCFYSHRDTGYKTFNNNRYTYIHFFDDGILNLQDGTSIYFENNNALGNFHNINDKRRILISVDLNGYLSKPNIWGIDLFTFQLIDGKLLPMGDFGTYYTGTAYCSKNNNDNKNGITCAHEAKNDPDYFKSVLNKK